jgi:MoaA/NifB/PqqE/SkfB family radical SAM enzyme
MLLSKKGDPHDILIKEIGEKFREYREKWDRSGKCILVQDFPLHLDFELSFKCNLRCKACVHSLPKEKKGKWGDPSKEFSYETYCHIIDEGAKYGLCSIDLNGICEPLLRRDLVNFISYASKKKILDIMFNTNALLLTKKRSEELLEAGLTRIMFSLDAIKESTYKKLRQGGNFLSVMNNIHCFLEMKKRLGKRLPITRVSFVVTKINHSDLDEFISYWKDYVDFLSIQSLSNPFIGTPYYYKAEKMLRSPVSKCDPNFICPQPYQRLYIRINGDVSPCCGGWNYSENVVGNIYQNSVYDIWNGQEMRKFRMFVNAEPKLQPIMCRKCRLSFNPERKKIDDFDFYKWEEHADKDSL